MLCEKPWQPDLVLRYLLMVMGGYCLGMLVVAWLGSKHAPFAIPEHYLTIIGGTVSFHGMILGFLPNLLREHERSFAAAFGFSASRRMRAVGLGLLLGAVTLPVIILLGELAANIMYWLNLRAELQTPVQLLQHNGSPAFYVVTFFAAVLVAPVAEEIVFRGILYSSVRELGFPRLALWGSSLLFAAVHFNAMTLLPFTVLALVLAFLYEKTGNLLSSIVMHSFFNLINFLRVAALPPT